MIINKYLKTIEFYDSNGSEYHERTYKNMDVKEISALLMKRYQQLQDYKIYSVEDTCPRKGPQHLDHLSKHFSQYKRKGLCAMWSIFSAHLRIKYYQMKPEVIQRKLTKTLETREPDEMREFIFNYMLFLEQNVLKFTSKEELRKPLRSSRKSRTTNEKELSFTSLFEPAFTKKMRDPEWKPFWVTEKVSEIKMIIKFFVEYLMEKYKNKVSVCTNNKIFFLWTDNNPTKFTGENELKKCIESKETDLILSRVGLHRWSENKQRFSNHMNLLVINKYLKTIEFYDSNGAEHHTRVYGDNVSNEVLSILFSKFPVLREYSIYTVADTCPDKGFQTFESKSKILAQYKVRGLCEIWNLFNAELRIKYYKMSPYKLREKINKEIIKYGGDKLKEFVFDYMLFIEKQLQN